MAALALKQNLQKINPNFAYQVLNLEMQIDSQQASNINIQQISKLMELYMIGVQVLQSKADKRFSYFYKKIQALMLKKPIVQQLHKSSGSKVRQSTINEINKVQLQAKKNEYDMQIFYNQGQYDNKRMKEIIKNAQSKLQKFQGKIKKDISKQQTTLQSRLQQRRMKSQASSSCKKIPFKNKQNNSPNRNAQKQDSNQVDARMQYFNGADIPKKRKGSAQKSAKIKRDYTYE